MNRDELNDKTKDELQELARDRDLAVSGTKDELVDRLLDDRERDDGRSPRSSSPFRRALGQLRDEFESTTGLRIEAVTSLSSTDDGWTGRVQVVEQRRVPPTADVLGIYDVALDGDGNMTSLDRSERITRGRLSS